MLPISGAFFILFGNHDEICLIFRLRNGKGKRAVFVSFCGEAHLFGLCLFDEIRRFFSCGKLGEIHFEISCIRIAHFVTDRFARDGIFLVRLNAGERNLGIGKDRRDEILREMLAVVGLFGRTLDVPEKHLDVLVRFANVSVFVLAEKLGIPETA